MTTAKPSPAPSHLEFPDPPEREPDDMTSFNQTNVTGNTHHLLQHLVQRVGDPETTLVAGEHYISLEPSDNMAGLKHPDLLVAVDVDPQAYYRSNAYVISEQGKPPDFVLEIASRGTGREDISTKREAYAALGIPEYWRFDETGQYHGTRLAGDRLVDGAYVPIDIHELAEGVLQGYSTVLDLNLRWENRRLGWHDPSTGQHIATFESEREARIQAEARANAAEARARELESELQRLRNG